MSLWQNIDEIFYNYATTATIMSNYVDPKWCKYEISLQQLKCM